MSSDRDAMYFPPPPPPPPPVLPLLLNDLPQFSSTCTIIPMQTTNCTVLSVVPVPCTCRQNPQQELLQARNRLWHFEGGQDPPHIKFYRYIEPVLQDGPK
ncbi:hypothetical protein C0J52_22898 [Blattella germanica]|nr:hypothetical protein C0J52_22898 [Blattella germanica]